MATPYFKIAPCQYLVCQNEITMKLYLHQVVEGANENQIEILHNDKHPAAFGSIAINDWTVIDGPDPNSKIVARAKGMHVQADEVSPATGWCTYFLIEFKDDRFKGSQLQVMGRILAAKGELAIVGGTGEFKMARGTIKYKKLTEGGGENIRELDIHAFYTPETPPAVQGTVTIANSTNQNE